MSYLIKGLGDELYKKGKCSDIERRIINSNGKVKLTPGERSELLTGMKLRQLTNRTLKDLESKHKKDKKIKL